MYYIKFKIQYGKLAGFIFPEKGIEFWKSVGDRKYDKLHGITIDESGVRTRTTQSYAGWYRNYLHPVESKTDIIPMIFKPVIVQSL